MAINITHIYHKCSKKQKNANYAKRDGWHTPQHVPPPGRLHHKSRSDKDLFEVGFVPAGGEAFVLDPNLERGFVLEHRQRGPAEDAKVRVRVAFADTALVFLKCHVELPMQAVLNAPVAAHRTGKAPRGKERAEDIITDFVAFLAIAERGADNDPDGLQARPAHRRANRPARDRCSNRASLPDRGLFPVIHAGGLSRARSRPPSDCRSVP